MKTLTKTEIKKRIEFRKNYLNWLHEKLTFAIEDNDIDMEDQTNVLIDRTIDQLEELENHL